MTRTERVALSILIGMVTSAIVIPAITPGDPLAITDVLSTRLVPPFGEGRDGSFHVLGTDRFGRDLLSRMMLAGRISLFVGLVGSALAAAAGGLIGLVAGWRGGALDRALMMLADGLLAIPRLVLLLVCAALWPASLTSVVIVLIATGWMGVARLVRAEAAGARSWPYIEAARALGVPAVRLVLRHVVPNAAGPAIVAMTLGVGNAILLESGLSFLGFGIQPPRPSWGNMIAGGRDLIVSAPWVALAPGLALVLTVVACTLLGDSLQERLSGNQSKSDPARTR